LAFAVFSDILQLSVGKTLNSELERLRYAVPTLPHKPRKTTIPTSAIEYIKVFEVERDMLLEENERLHGLRLGNVRAITRCLKIEKRSLLACNDEFAFPHG